MCRKIKPCSGRASRYIPYAQVASFVELVRRMNEHVTQEGEVGEKRAVNDIIGISAHVVARMERGVLSAYAARKIFNAYELFKVSLDC